MEGSYILGVFNTSTSPAKDMFRRRRIGATRASRHGISEPLTILPSRGALGQEKRGNWRLLEGRERGAHQFHEAAAQHRGVRDGSRGRNPPARCIDLRPPDDAARFSSAEEWTRSANQSRGRRPAGRRRSSTCRRKARSPLRAPRLRPGELGRVVLGCEEDELCFGSVERQVEKKGARRIAGGQRPSLEPVTLACFKLGRKSPGQHWNAEPEPYERFRSL
jgi:hypothetical protein